MLYSTQTDLTFSSFGVKDGIRLLAQAGYTALDWTAFGNIDYALSDGWKQTSDAMRELAGENGVVFTQCHAPFGGGYKHYTENLVPLFPRVFEFAARLGVKNVVVHPLQRGRYYGHEKELFDLNVDFYRRIAPLAYNAGIRIAIENMWQTHPVTGVIVDDVCADPYELRNLYDTLDRPDIFTVCLDIGHVALCGREPEDAVTVIGHDRLGALHVHDVNYREDLHTLPGVSRLNWDAICRSLASVDYSGDFTLEADNFLVRFEKEFRPTAMKFMADRARFLSERIEYLKSH